MKLSRVLFALVLMISGSAGAWWAMAQTGSVVAAITGVPGMPAVLDPANLYS